MAIRFSLDGDWSLYTWVEGTLPIRTPDELLASALAPIPARVPGNVELDLVRAGLLPDPFYGDQIRLLRPLESHEWWYTRELVVPLDGAGHHWELVFAGIDTLATIWVNGIEVGTAADMFIEHRFDVTGALRYGEANRVTVRLGSAVRAAAQFRYDAASMSWEGREEGLFIRKAPHVWGWDIMPRAVSAGLWRSVWLEERPANAIEQLYLWTADVGAHGATLGVRFQLRTDVAEIDTLSLRIRGSCGEATFAHVWPLEFIAGGFRIPVPGARLWWPRGYGEPALYTVTAQLCQGQRVLAERVERVGIRKVELRRTATGGPAWRWQPPEREGVPVDVPPDPAHHFLFVVNGEPVMIKGTNWVPLDAFHSRDAARVDQALALVADLECTMVRCWGGNVVEDQRFFDLCDELGILVWQDLPFACCRYPMTDDFLAQVRRETEAIAEKLRNHASLAVWCGDNEIDAAYVGDGLSPQQNRLTREVIPQALHRCDPYRAYVPSSPYVSPELEATPGGQMPEQHLWGPRGYYKSPFYAEHSAHFIGEIGYHGCPNVATIKEFISPEALWPWQNNDEWQVHAVYHWFHKAVSRDRIQLMANQIRELFGAVPEDLESFVLASQIVQAEAKKSFIESTRLRKWKTSGILWWNVLDGWPQFSDAVVDYAWRKKLAYHYIWRVQRPVCVVVGEAASGKYLPVMLCNDTRLDADVTLRVRRADDPELLLERTLTVPANHSVQAGRIRSFASDQTLYLLTWEMGGATFGNHYLSGWPPFSLETYRHWLKAIAELPRRFDCERVAD